MSASVLFAQTTTYTTYETSSSEGGASAVWLFIAFALIALTIVSCWRLYQKARKPGWAALIPIYNIYVLLQIIGRPGWWLLLYFVPFVNAIVHIIVSIDLAKAFRKDAAFGVLWLWLIPVVGYLILGFGNAAYKSSGKK